MVPDFGSLYLAVSGREAPSSHYPLIQFGLLKCRMAGRIRNNRQWLKQMKATQMARATGIILLTNLSPALAPADATGARTRATAEVGRFS